MNIACILNAHGETELTLDTIDALRTYVSEDILVVCDGSTWDSWGKKVNLPAMKMEGLAHGYHKGSYKNMIFGVQQAANLWPQADWYLYLEYDVLFTSDSFKQDLANFKKENIWCIGTNGRVETKPVPYLDKLFGFECEKYCYLLGCCLFLDSVFINKLKAINFFDRFLTFTNGLDKDFFPGFDGYDIGEFIFPTLAVHLGGKFHHLSSWNAPLGHWVGHHKKYPMRWKPEITLDETTAETCIIHPSKSFSDIRWLNNRRRRKLKNESSIVGDSAVGKE